MFKKPALSISLAALLALCGAAQAAFDTVGVYDPDDEPHNNQVDQSGAYASHTGNAGPGNVIDLATFQALIGPAFSADAGGVVDAETANGDLDGEDIIANFGVSGTKSVTISSTSGHLGRGSGGGSGNRLPTSGNARFWKDTTGDFVFDIGAVTGGAPGEAVTHFAGTLVYRDNRDMDPQVTATFSGGGTVTATADMTSGGPSNSRDTFFGFAAPRGESIVNVDFDLANYTHMDDVAFITSAFVVLSDEATYPSPADTATDVGRDVVLTWTAGHRADKHDVYLGTDEADVTNADRDDPRNVLLSRGQDPNRYPADGNLVLEYGKTYFWRIDEVGAPGDTTIYEGDIWRFTVEPLAYAIAGDEIVADASSQDSAEVGPGNTVNGSGLDADGLLHDRDVEGGMWLSSSAAGPVWIKYEFEKVYKLHEMWVWNFNGNYITHFGLQNVTIEYSTDDIEYVRLGTTHEFAEASGTDDYAHDTVVDFGGAATRFVRITPNSNWGTSDMYGLSEVRFFRTPVRAREPNPSPGATDLDLDLLLSWRAGREAASHLVYFSTDKLAVVNGTVAAATPSDTSYDPGRLELGKTYYWKVTEINDAAVPTTWEGDLWSFSTHEYFVVDDFEDYNDYSPHRIFQTWIDGFGYSDPPPGREGNGTGSTVGYLSPPFAEQTIIHEGKQSMPMDYNNINLPFYSEAERTFDTPQDWTRDAVKALTLHFRGYPAALVESPPGTYTMSAAGEDIWNTADEFRFAFKRLSGDGSIEAQVLSIENTDNWAKAGVMIRHTLNPDSKAVWVIVSAANGVQFGRRPTTAYQCGDDQSTNEGGITAPHWVKLTRSGNTFIAQHSAGGENWVDVNDPTNVSSDDVAMPSDVYIGLCLTSHNVDETCVAEFSDVTTDGDVTGVQWQAQAIGADMIANTAEQLYVAVEDSAGISGVAKHPDPAAVTSKAWQQWNIDLREFSNANVNLASIQKMYIGVGDRFAPQPGSTGTLYFDDVRLYPTRCILSNRSADFAARDYVEDCVVDGQELAVMWEDWLLRDRTASGLRAHWAFEGDTADSSGNGYDGDPCGSPSYVLGSSGQGKAISLDRGGDVITHNLVLPLQMGTVTHWLKPDMLDRMVAYYEGSGPENGWTAGDNDILEIHSGINGTDGRWYFCYQDGPGGGSSATITTAATAQAGVWTHFAATWDRSSDLILYADGVEIGRTDLTGENFLSNAGVYHLIGGPGDRDAGRDWDGAIDDVRVYDYALSPDEIETVMDGGSLGPRYYALTSPANVYDAEPINSKSIDFRDFAQLADMWLDEQLWPR